MRPENAEFAELFKASGWTQAEAARRLGLNRATISRYLAEDEAQRMPPSETVLLLFRTILQQGPRREHLDDRQPQDRAWEDLQDLRRRSPATYRAAVATIAALKRQFVGGVSSTVASIAEASAPAALRAALSAPESKPKRKAAAPTYNKPAPTRAVARPKAHKPAPPTPAPKPQD